MSIHFTLVSAMENEQNPITSSERIEKTIETEDKDIFDDVFEEDEEEKAAKKKRNEGAAELKKQQGKKKEEDNDDEGGTNGKDDDEDDDEEIEEDEKSSAEPVIFGEVNEKETDAVELAEESEEDGEDEEEEFETKGGQAKQGFAVRSEATASPRAFDAVDAGGKRKKSKSNFDDLVKDGLEKSLNGGEEKKNGNGTGKGMGGKLDLKVIHEEEGEEDLGPAHPMEKKVIKSVIKNKAIMAAKEDVIIKKGVKISDDSFGKPREEGEEHEALADALLREEGIREEGVNENANGEEDRMKNEDEQEEGSGAMRMPKAKIVEEVETDSDDEKPGKIAPALEFLMSAKGRAFIGRKKSVLGKYGEEAGLFVGRVNEDDKRDTEILLDGLNPHVVFVCGARGSGKSYVLGVVAEELALKNKNVGIVVVDPIGVFWSMKHPNKEEKELEALAKWGLMPQGLDNIKVFIPVGMKNAVPKSTFDAVFSIQPALLTAEDWCLTFGIDRFSPTGLLMEKGIVKTKSGYTNLDGKEIRGKENTFSLEDLIMCFENDAELNDKERGYKADSIRALASRFDAAKHWGIFDEKGTSLGLLSRAGQMTILDTSFLEDNVSALVVGIISRRILAARKLGTRREAAGKFDEAGIEEITELNIPPTWLFIDEAHTLIPGGNQKTPASNALVEYVKQGRRPGCSLVFATQQPSAIDTKVLSQLDIIMAHKLVFDDDIKSIYKRMPAITPHQYKKSNFIKTMPVGIALTGDRSETTSRAFVMSIRPRMSQHEGRDAETSEVKMELEENQVEVLATNIVLRQLEKDPSIRMDSLEETLDTLNNTYKKSIQLEVILEELRKKGVTVKPDALFAPGVAEEIAAEAEAVELAQEQTAIHEEIEKGRKKIGVSGNEEEKMFEESVELTALQTAIPEQRARQIFASNISKKFMFLDQEIVERVTLKYAPIYRVRYKYFNHKDAFQAGEAYINSISGEFIHDDRGKLKGSKGLSKLLELSETETTLLKLVAEKKRKAKEVSVLMKMEEGNAKRILEGLAKKGFVGIDAQENGSHIYNPNGKVELDLPPSPLHAILSSIGRRPITEIESAALVSPNLHEKEVPGLLKKLWGNVVVKEITHVFLPVWEGTLKKKTGEERTILIDGINGNKI